MQLGEIQKLLYGMGFERDSGAVVHMPISVQTKPLLLHNLPSRET